jgi:hypothetical protein
MIGYDSISEKSANGKFCSISWEMRGGVSGTLRIAPTSKLHTAHRPCISEVICLRCDALLECVRKCKKDFEMVVGSEVCLVSGCIIRALSLRCFTDSGRFAF